MDDLQRRIARARLLRREGKTYDEIRAALDVQVSDERMRDWLKGIPRPPATRRAHPLTELRQACRRLRALGYTYSEIAEATGASAGSISPWVRDIQVGNRERGENRRLDALRESARTRSRQAHRRRELQGEFSAASIGPMTERELFLLGVGLYWAEGSKSKPYAIRERVTFINSDPSVVEVFMAWLELVGVATDECAFRVSIHETADIEAAETYWSSLLGIPHSALSRTTVKRHRPQTNRLNVGLGYHGCLIISVYQSAALYRSIAGWWQGIRGQVKRTHRRGADWGEVPPWRIWRLLQRKLEPPIPGCSVGRGDETLNLGTT